MPTEILTNGSRWAGDRVAMFDPYSMWLAFYREPTSIIFNRTPANWDELNTLILAKRIDFSGLYDSGGHPLVPDSAGARVRWRPGDRHPWPLRVPK